MVQDIFKYFSPNIAKLSEYGFTVTDKVYRYETNILNNQFSLSVDITESGKISTKVVDVKSHDEYVLHLIDGSVGGFVGKVRAEFENVLTDIRDKCFEKDIFKSEQAKRIIEYVRAKYGDELEYLWEKFPNNAIWRRKDNKKWYGALLVLSKRKLGIDSDDIVDIIDLRINPDIIKDVVDRKSYFEGYHMNKKNWFTICLDNSVPTETIFYYLDKSYELALK